MIDLQSFILNYINEFSYFGIFLLAILASLIPLPEELLLLLAGYFSGKGFAELDKVILAAYLGILAGDNILFFLFKKTHYLHKTYAKYIKLGRLKKWKRFMREHHGKSIFLLRFFLGLRFLGLLMAATMKIRWPTFQFFNFLAVSILVPFYILVGYLFSNILSEIIRDVLILKYFIVAFIIILIVIPYLIFLKRLFKK